MPESLVPERRSLTDRHCSGNDAHIFRTFYRKYIVGDDRRREEIAEHKDRGRLMLWLYSWAVALRPSPRTIWLSLVPLLVVGAGAAVNIAGGAPIVATLVAFILQSIVLHAAARALWRRRVRSDIEQIVAREIHWVRRHKGGFTGTITIDVRPSGQIEVERRARQQELGHGSDNVPVQRADSVVAVSPHRTGQALTRVILAAAILGVTGCGAAALYQNPTTGQTQLCQQDTNALMLWGFDTGYTACKDALERAGWKRL